MTDGSWAPAGEDAAGWLYTQQTYDWRGRPRVTTNTDGTQRSASYDGCGCAGGEVVTLADEEGRGQKFHGDPLGRRWKTEILHWDGSVYSTTTNKIDALDRATVARRYEGTDASGVYQEATKEYDGHGRLKSSHAPAQEAGKDTVYAYYDDDTLKSVTDARGAVTTYTYNEPRRLVTGITYTAPSGIAAPPPVTYVYDAAGNRTSMTTGGGQGGSLNYHYDAMSRLTSEDRQFPGLSGAYTLAYEYTLSGQLKKVADQAGGTSVTYTVGAAGQITAVTSEGMGASTPLMSGAQYSAWGALKSAAFGDDTGVTLGYDERGLLKRYELSGVKDPNTGAVRPEGAEVQYFADRRVKFASDFLSRAQGTGLLDRAYSYDHAARLKEAYSGADARGFAGDPAPGSADSPYRHSYTYDAWDNLKTRAGRYWSQDDTDSEEYAPQTNRNPQWDYDEDGRLLSRDEPSPNGLTYVPARFTYDAAGRRVQTTQTTSRTVTIQNVLVTTGRTLTDTYDGDGMGVRRVTATKINSNAPTTATIYYLRSSVLGGRLVAEYSSQGSRQTSYAYAGGEVLAVQRGADTGAPVLAWQHMNPVTGDARETDSSGRVKAETRLDPEGVDVGAADPFSPGEAGDLGGGGAGLSQSQLDATVGDLIPGWGGQKCTVDGLLLGCKFVTNLEESGAAERCRDDDCGPHSVTVIARNKNGEEIDSTTSWRYAGQPGWDGSLDGIYRVNPYDASRFNVGTAAGAASFLDFISSGPSLYGDSFYSELVQKVSGSPPPPKIPALKNATPEQKSRFDAAFREMWNRLHENGGDNPCAQFFGGLKKAEKALKDLKFSVGPTRNSNAAAQIKGDKVTINPTGGFFDDSGTITIGVGIGYSGPGQSGGPRQLNIILDNDEGAALFLLHELGHRTDKLEPDGDSPTGLESIMNNGTVRKACFSEAIPY